MTSINDIYTNMLLEAEETDYEETDLIDVEPNNDYEEDNQSETIEEEPTDEVVEMPETEDDTTDQSNTAIEIFDKIKQYFTSEPEEEVKAWIDETIKRDSLQSVDAFLDKFDSYDAMNDAYQSNSTEEATEEEMPLPDESTEEHEEAETEEEEAEEHDDESDIEDEEKLEESTEYDFQVISEPNMLRKYRDLKRAGWTRWSEGDGQIKMKRPKDYIKPIESEEEETFVNMSEAVDREDPTIARNKRRDITKKILTKITSNSFVNSIIKWEMVTNAINDIVGDSEFITARDKSKMNNEIKTALKKCIADCKLGEVASIKSNLEESRLFNRTLINKSKLTKLIEELN